MFAHSLNVKKFYFTHRWDLSGSITPGVSEPGSSGNEGILCIHQNFSINGASPSNCLVSCPGLTPLQRCSQCIPQPQPSRPSAGEEAINAEFTKVLWAVDLLTHSTLWLKNRDFYIVFSLRLSIRFEGFLLKMNPFKQVDFQ